MTDGGVRAVACDYDRVVGQAQQFRLNRADDVGHASLPQVGSPDAVLEEGVACENDGLVVVDRNADASGRMAGGVNDARLNGTRVHAVAIGEKAIDLSHLGCLEWHAKRVELHLHALVEKQIVFVDHRRGVGRLLHFGRRAHVVKMGMRVNDRGAFKL